MMSAGQRSPRREGGLAKGQFTRLPNDHKHPLSASSSSTPIIIYIYNVIIILMTASTPRHHHQVDAVIIYNVIIIIMTTYALCHYYLQASIKPQNPFKMGQKNRMQAKFYISDVCMESGNIQSLVEFTNSLLYYIVNTAVACVCILICP